MIALPPQIRVFLYRLPTDEVHFTTELEMAEETQGKRRCVGGRS